MRRLVPALCLLALSACTDYQRGATDAYVRQPDGSLDCPAFRLGLMGCRATLHDHVGDCTCAGASMEKGVRYFCRNGLWLHVSGSCPPLSPAHR